LAVWSLHWKKFIGFPFSSDISFKETVHIKNYFENFITVTAGVTTTTCTWLTECHVLFKHFESESVYKITDIYILTYFSLLKHNTKTYSTLPKLKRKQ
jgi:hypothetical protein